MWGHNYFYYDDTTHCFSSSFYSSSSFHSLTLLYVCICLLVLGLKRSSRLGLSMIVLYYRITVEKMDIGWMKARTASRKLKQEETTKYMESNPKIFTQRNQGVVRIVLRHGIYYFYRFKKSFKYLQSGLHTFSQSQLNQQYINVK